MNSRWRNVTFSIVGLATLLAGVACGASTSKESNPANASGNAAQAVDPKKDWPKTFTIGFFAGDDAEKTLANNAPMKNYLEKKLGIPVNAITGTSYTAVIEAMRVNKADAMEVGPFSYALAVGEDNAEAIAVSIACPAKEKQPDCKFDAKAKPFYQSTIITKKGNGIASLADLKGKSFSFVDPASTSGHLAPKTMLIKAGYTNPDKDLKTIFAGSHPASALSVYNGKTDAGATFESNLENLVASKQIDACMWPDGKINELRSAEDIKKAYDACPNGKLVILGVSDPIPNTPLAVRQNLPESFKAALKDALISMKDDPAVVQDARRWFVDPTKELGLKKLDNFYDPLRDIAKLLNLDLKSVS